MLNRSFAVTLLSMGACAIEGGEADVDNDLVLAEISIPSGANYQFVGVPEEDGTLAGIGLIETSRPGLRSIQEVTEARGLDAVAVFRALAPAGVEPPAALLELEHNTNSGSAEQPRGWLAQQLSAAMRWTPSTGPKTG